MKLEDSTGTKKFVWDDQNYLAETDASDITQVVYTNELRRYGNFVSQRRGGTTNWYHFDAIGSTRDLTLASQAVSDTYVYDAWGNVIAGTGSTANPFLFVGQLGYYKDTDSNRYYVRDRLYTPIIARWLSQDAVHYVAYTNAYAYSSSTPINRMDPSGKQDKQEPSTPDPKSRGFSFTKYLRCLIDDCPAYCDQEMDRCTLVVMYNATQTSITITLMKRSKGDCRASIDRTTDPEGTGRSYITGTANDGKTCTLTERQFDYSTGNTQNLPRGCSGWVTFSPPGGGQGPTGNDFTGQSITFHDAKSIDFDFELLINCTCRLVEDRRDYTKWRVKGKFEPDWKSP